MKKGTTQAATAFNIAASGDEDGISVVKIGHNQYMHILDKNSNTTRYLKFFLKIFTLNFI